MTPPIANDPQRTTRRGGGRSPFPPIRSLVNAPLQSTASTSTGEFDPCRVGLGMLAVRLSVDADTLPDSLGVVHTLEQVV